MAAGRTARDRARRARSTSRSASRGARSGAAGGGASTPTPPRRTRGDRGSGSARRAGGARPRRRRGRAPCRDFERAELITRCGAKRRIASRSSPTSGGARLDGGEVDLERARRAALVAPAARRDGRCARCARPLRSRRLRNAALTNRCISSIDVGSGTATRRPMSASRNSSSVGDVSPGPRSTTTQSADSCAELLGDRADRGGLGLGDPRRIVDAARPAARPGRASATASSASGGPSGANASESERDGRGTPAKMCRFGAPNAPSTSTTRLPSVARKIPTFAATRLLPTPPLPPPMATTRGVMKRHARPRAAKRKRDPGKTAASAGRPRATSRRARGPRRRPRPARRPRHDRPDVEPQPAVLDPADHRHRRGAQRRARARRGCRPGA